MAKIYWSGRQLIVEGAEVLWGTFRNFGGAKRKFNDAGKRNFNISVDPENISMLMAENINVKYFKSDYDDDEEQDEKPGFTRINVNYESYSKPEIYVRSNPQTRFVEFNEDLVGRLDGMVFDQVDLVLNPYKRDDEHTSLYLEKGYFTLHSDPISEKYSTFSPIDQSSMLTEDTPF